MLSQMNTQQLKSIIQHCRQWTCELNQHFLRQSLETIAKNLLTISNSNQNIQQSMKQNNSKDIDINTNKVQNKQRDNNTKNVYDQFNQIHQRRIKQVQNRVKDIMGMHHMIQEEQRVKIYQNLEIYHKKVNSLTERIQQIEISLNNNHNKQLKADNQKCEYIIAKQWVNKESQSYGQLILHQNKIIANQNSVNVFGKANLRETNQFNLKINKINESLNIGIIDSKLRSQQSNKYGQNFIGYDNDGLCWWGPYCSNAGKGFKEEEQVRVKVDFKSGTVQWLVNDKPSYRTQFSGLKDENIQWVPYINLSDQGDSVSLLQ